MPNPVDNSAASRIAVKPLAPGNLRRPIARWSASGQCAGNDAVSIEEPLEIRLSHHDGAKRCEQSIAITMRTPGHDEALAIGFLVGEGIVRRAEDVRAAAHCGPPSPDKGLRNVMRVELDDRVRVDLDALKRHFYTSSSCGVCGKASLDAIATQLPDCADSGFTVAAKRLRALPAELGKRQDEFALTGGLHAAASFDAGGRLQRLREDVGRHNALDKLAGSYFRVGGLSALGILLSGRASFELIQKAAMAGVGLVAAIGAPSSLAIELSEQRGITLVGFLKAGGFNLYCHGQRILAA